jgi:hypothetical protein
VFDLTFGCRYRTISCLKIAAHSHEEATKIAQDVLRDSRLHPSDEDAPAEYLAAMGMTQLLDSSLLGIRPGTDPKKFDMGDADLGKFLGAAKKA